MEIAAIGYPHPATKTGHYGYGMNIQANIVDILNEKITAGTVTVSRGRISKIVYHPGEKDTSYPYILPGFIDAHVHIESSMLVPSEFARLAVVHGTVATISDPHEIANVCGLKGVEYMIANGKSVNFKFSFGAPGCVPATAFETSGDTIDANDIKNLLKNPDIKYLSEVMNFPGVIEGDKEVMKKIAAARAAGKPVDGHAPGLSGDALKHYHAAGISTDHECFTAREALEKLQLGMKILIREGSAAKNFEALIMLLNDYPAEMMFCSDDKHPDSLVKGHINQLCQRAVSKNINVFKVLRAACVNPVQHYKLDVGLLQINAPADFILVRDLKEFEVLQTFINGICVADNGKTLISSQVSSIINNFNCTPITVEDIICLSDEQLRSGQLPVILALDGQLITHKLMADPKIESDSIVSDIEKDILKIIVVNRYTKAPVAKAFIKNFGLRHGAIASSVAHDSHNIIAVGVEDENICLAVNKIIEYKGGISCALDKEVKILSLPVAGLMSVADGYTVASSYTEIDSMAKSMGSSLSAPFMTLSFMALLVIPSLKLSDWGLFDGESFQFL
jgi:adenine deaminase